MAALTRWCWLGWAATGKKNYWCCCCWLLGAAAAAVEVAAGGAGDQHLQGNDTRRPAHGSTPWAGWTAGRSVVVRALWRGWLLQLAFGGSRNARPMAVAAEVARRGASCCYCSAAGMVARASGPAWVSVWMRQPAEGPRKGRWRAGEGG